MIGVLLYVLRVVCCVSHCVLCVPCDVACVLDCGWYALCVVL